jgi:hypothetical protein
VGTSQQPNRRDIAGVFGQLHLQPPFQPHRDQFLEQTIRPFDPQQSGINLGQHLVQSTNGP